MTRRQTYPDPVAVVLPVGLNAWLTDCVPAPNCVPCQQAWEERRKALLADDLGAAMKASTHVRDHASGVHEDDGDGGTERDCSGSKGK